MGIRIHTKRFAVCFIFLLFAATHHVFASPVVKLPENLEMSPGSRIKIPITAGGLSGESFGFFLRLDYDDTILTRPEIIHNETLVGHLEILHKLYPEDGIGKLSIGVMDGFISGVDEGTLIIIQFAVDSNAAQDTGIRFAAPNTKTVLFTQGYDTIQTDFIPGSLKLAAPPAVRPSTEPDTPPPADPPVILTDCEKSLLESSNQNNPALWDFNSDGVVDIFDLQKIAGQWLMETSDPGWDFRFDLHPDCRIDEADLKIFTEHWLEVIEAP